MDGVPQPVPLPELFESDMLRVDTIKFLADGGLSGATAALSVLPARQTREAFCASIATSLKVCAAKAHEAGWRIATHAIGDVAIDQMLDIYEASDRIRAAWRTASNISACPTRRSSRARRSCGVIAAPQTIFIHSLGRNFRSYLPDSFIPRTYPIRAMLDAGVRVALSSDAPVVEDDNPLVGMMAAITRRDREGNAIAPEQAIMSTKRCAATPWAAPSRAARSGTAERSSQASGRIWRSFRTTR